MSQLVRTLYHGSANWLRTVTGESGIAVVNEDEHRIHVMDGKREGGHPLALLSEVPTDAIRTSSQALSDSEKEQARKNIGALSGDDIPDLLSIYENAKL